MIIDFDVSRGQLTAASIDDKNIISWETFSLLSGKHIDLNKRIGKKIRVFRDLGNIYVSDHSWILYEKYKKKNLKTQVVHINAEGEALMNNLQNRLNVITSIEPLEWTIE